METILIVDDNEDLRWNLSNVLKDAGYETVAAGGGREALKMVEKNSPNLVLLDIRLPEVDGMKILEKMKKIDKDLAIIMLTAYGDIKGAVEAMKLGASDYITKPFDSDELVLTIKRALERQYLSREVEILRRRLGEGLELEKVMGNSPQIQRVLERVKVVAPTNMTVVLQGESGSGKEIVAQLIHQNSRRRGKSFIAIDCGALPETLLESELFGYEKGAFTGAAERKDGRFELADSGTLFLDEVTNLTHSAQMRFLRALEERKVQRVGGKHLISVDVRVIVAATMALEDAVRQGKMRADLFYRLNEFSIDLPPLRERKDDVPILAKYFLDEVNYELNKKVKDISAEAMGLLLGYLWPGNIRELRNVVRRAVLLAEDIILPQHLSLNMKEASSVKKESKFQVGLEEGATLRDTTRKVAEEVEKDLIAKVLAQANGNKTKAAKILGIDRSALYYKMKRFGL